MPRDIKSVVKQASAPVIFVSHVSRDAALAEAFSKLLRSVSAGLLRPFRSSDRKGSEGIEYGLEWYPTIMSKLNSAPDVICLLTQNSLQKPWILYEAGIAKGKESTVYGIAFGIPLNDINTGPFAQFQNCDNADDSLTALVMQLLRRIPLADPDPITIANQVSVFRRQAQEILANTDDPSPDKLETAAPNNLNLSPKESGLVNVSDRLEANTFINRMMTANSISILNTWIPDLFNYTKALKEAILRKATVRILMLNPHSRITSFRNDALGIAKAPPTDSIVALGVKKCLEDLRAIVENTPQDNRRYLQVRLYNSLPSISAYVADEKILAGVFFHGRLAILSPQFDVLGVDSVLGEHITNEINTLWEIAYEIRDLSNWHNEIGDHSAINHSALTYTPQMAELDNYENGLIEQLRNHEVLQHIGRLTPENFLEVLLQRRFISFAFTSIYDFAIDALQDNSSKVLAGRIVRDEYPNGDSPSHREDLFHDLELLGATRQQIVGSKPTETTAEIIRRSVALVTDLKIGPSSDIVILTALRFLEEIAVAVEYEAYWKRILPVFTKNGNNSSKFYYPHLFHDSKTTSLANTSALSSSHSDRLGIRLKEMISSHEAQDLFIKTEKVALEIKLAFYDQFSEVVAQCTG